MRFRFRLRHLLIVVALSVIVFVVSLLPGYARPKIVVTVTGEHNPIEDLVFVNDVRVFPSGEGGRTYTARGKSGENKITLNGPYIKQSEASVSASYFDQQKVEMPVVSRNMEAIIRETLDEPTADIRGLREYRRSGVLVFSLDSPKHPAQTEEYVNDVLLYYDEVARSWLNLTLSLLANPDFFTVDEAARDYFHELLGDL